MPTAPAISVLNGECALCDINCICGLINQRNSYAIKVAPDEQIALARGLGMKKRSLQIIC